MASDLLGQSQSLSSVPTVQVPDIRKPELTLSNANSIDSGMFAFSSNGHYFAWASNNSIRIYEVRFGEKVTASLARTLAGHSAPLLGLAFSETNTLVSISRD